MENIKSIINKTKCLVLDMDGTIYLDSTPIGDMINTLKICREKGIKIYYFTNNSSKNFIEYVNKLSKIGFYDDKGNFHRAPAGEFVLKEKGQTGIYDENGKFIISR